MKKFATYLFLFLLPLIVIMLPFFIGDPFKILHHYDRYYPEDGQPLYLNINRSYVSTRMYIQYKDSFQYNSFIFGSSRSEHFLVKDWKQYLPDSASCFHFDGYSDPLYSIHKKILFLDKQHAPIDNVIICFDAENLAKSSPIDNDHLRALPPLLDYSWSTFEMFYKTHLNVYFEPHFYVSYIDFLLHRQIKPYMTEWGIWDIKPSYYILRYNEREEKLADDTYPESHYSPNLLAAFESAQSEKGIPYDHILNAVSISMLQEIADVFEKHHTDYKIVLSPMYDQRPLSAIDVTTLEQIFEERIYNFTGENIWNSDYHNYNDPAHFSDRVASKIMQIIYEPDSVRQQQMLDSIYNLPK